MLVLCDIEAVTYRTIDTAAGYEQCMGSWNSGDTFCKAMYISK